MHADTGDARYLSPVWLGNHEVPTIVVRLLTCAPPCASKLYRDRFSNQLLLVGRLGNLVNRWNQNYTSILASSPTADEEDGQGGTSVIALIFITKGDAAWICFRNLV